VAAGLLAVAIAMWPACSQDHPDATRANLGFVLKDMSGKDVRLADLKGRPMLINFWATWCGPCKAEIPILMELAEKYKEEDFTVLGVSIDDSPELLQQFAARHNVNYPLLVGAGHDDLLEAYDAGFVVPVSWLIRRDGTVAAKKSGGASREWFETQVKALF
jgi:thiol-disulfide isomerase/thioredoxin